jgi:tetratricopeptide (TPR) repeat protein
MFRAARYRAFRSSVGHMTHRSIFSSSKCRMVFLARIALAGLLSFSTNSFAKDNAWTRCRGADPDARIAGCSQVIARESKESKRNRIVAFINRGGAYQAKGDFDQAIADLNKALQLDPKSALAFSDRASIYRAKGDLDRTIADYDAAIAAQPKFAIAFLGRGEAYQTKNDLHRAIADYGKALELDHKLVAAYDNRARAYRAGGDLDNALADFDEAIKLEPRSALVHVDRGAVYQAKGDLDRAIADYDEAIELDPKYANAFLNGATVYLEKRDFERAKENLEAALKLNPQLGSAKKALDDVNELIARNATAAPTAPVSPPAAAPKTMPSDRWIVALLGLALSAFIGWIVWFFWLKRTKGVNWAETTSGYHEGMEQASMTTSTP